MSLESTHEVFSNQDYIAAAERKKKPDTSGLRALGRFARLVASDETALKIQNKYDSWREKRRAKKREGEVPFDTLFALGEGTQDAIEAQKAGVVLEQPEPYTPDPNLVPRAKGNGIYQSQSQPTSAGLDAEDLMAHATQQSMHLLRDLGVEEFRLPADVSNVGGDSPTELPDKVAPRALTQEERDAGGLVFEKDRYKPQHPASEAPTYTTVTTAEFQARKAARQPQPTPAEPVPQPKRWAETVAADTNSTPAVPQPQHAPRQNWHDENTGPNPLVGANN